jgi:MGT family glycosyltransferase
MKRIHICFFGFPHFGHVNPTLPIVSVMVRRGYRVTYLTSSAFSQAISELGAEVVPCPAFEIGSGPPNFDSMLNRILGLTERTLEVVEAFFRSNKPNLIMYDFMSFAGRVLAQRFGIPAVQISPTFFVYRNTCWKDVTDPNAESDVQRRSARTDEFLKKLGIESDGYAYGHSEKLNIHLYSGAFEPNPNSFGPEHFYAGRCAGERQPYGEWTEAESDGPPIALIKSSTTYVRRPEDFRLFIDALCGVDWRVIVSVGDNYDATALFPLPKQCELVRHGPYLRILPHASVLICQGGMITCGEAAYHGVPLVTTSHANVDLELHSNNIARLGIGIHLRESEMDVDHVRTAATLVLRDEVILGRVREIQRIVRREPGGEETTNRVEEFLGI